MTATPSGWCYVCRKHLEPGDETEDDRILVSIRCGANPGRTYTPRLRHKGCKPKARR